MADWKESDEEEIRPPFLLKVDSPMDSSDDSTGNSSNEDTETKAKQSGTMNKAEDGPAVSQKPEKRPVHFQRNVLGLNKSRHPFGSSDFSNSASKSRSVILRPSQLGSISNSSPAPTKSVLQPARFQNPFTKGASENSTEEKPSTENNKTTEETKSKSEEKSTEDSNPKFLPLGTKDNEVNKDVNSVNSAIEATTSTPVFVFGQNLKERVAVANDEKNSEKAEAEEPKKEETSTENGSAELLFSAAASACRTTTKPGLTLTQAAQELEEANRANKRKYSEVTLLTGEEGETNVLQVNCKLFAFDKATSGWQERGRGTLRLNDRDEEESRLVIRTTGTQRVILNTKIWPAMTAERAGPKSLRLTAMDVNGDIRIFIVQAGPMETEQLHNLLLPRIKKAQERQPKKLATEH